MIANDVIVRIDAFSFELGYAKELAAALIKLQIQNLSSMVRNIPPSSSVSLEIKKHVLIDCVLGRRLVIFLIPLLPPNSHGEIKSRGMDQ